MGRDEGQHFYKRRLEDVENKMRKYSPIYLGTSF